MEVAHDSILGGHLGGKKTSDRVPSNFHWPGVAGDVQRYVQSYDICQWTIPKGRNVKVRKTAEEEMKHEKDGNIKEEEFHRKVE